MKSINFINPPETTFSIGETVWVISRDYSCPASNKENYFKTQVVRLNTRIFFETNNSYEAVISGVEVQHGLTRSWDFPRTQILSTRQVYKKEEDAKRLSQWIPVELDDNVYMEAIGSRDYISEDSVANQDTYRLCENTYSDLIDEIHKEWVYDLKFPWTVASSAEDSELGICCANTSDIRDNIIKCAHLKGLIQYDIETIKTKIKASHPEYLQDEHKFSNLTKIMKALGIKNQ